MRSVHGDIRDADLVKKLFAGFRPEIVFHLAAQSLVRLSYDDPLQTYSTNVMGTANALEASRLCDSVRAIVVVTSDKCYLNHESGEPFREDDRLGGYDPYSNSKACSELVVSAYRDSFFNGAACEQYGVALASARAGNVIGGGDWARDRLVPDLIRGFSRGETVLIRNPFAVRPWQHVLEPLSGYLMLAESLFDHGPVSAEAWNFGPRGDDLQTVGWIADETARLWGESARWEQDRSGQRHEAQALRVDCSKAAGRLGWRPSLCLKDALTMTVDWCRAREQGNPIRAFTLGQISNYEERVCLSRESGTNP
jgi:CDP-glucose 4,6-dehydratase